MLSADALEYVDRSVLCWLATSDGHGQPNVSPKEVFAAFDDSRIVIAHIASPNSVRNVRRNPRVCVSFVDVFTQRGYKIVGTATVVDKDDPRFGIVSAPLIEMTQGVFPIHAVIDVQVTEVFPILAPSYNLVPGTTEASQIEAAMQNYGVRRRGDPSARSN